MNNLSFLWKRLVQKKRVVQKKLEAKGKEMIRFPLLVYGERSEDQTDSLAVLPPQLRKTQLINLIPHQGAELNLRFHSGYYRDELRR